MRGLWFRALLPAAIVATGFVGFSLGGEVSERIVPQTALPRLYYAISLFVMGGLDLGVPSGGPNYARGLLWFSFFAAPTLTATALLEAVWRLALPMAHRLRRMHDHTVVVGAGRLGALYIRKLREQDPKAAIVLVERNADQSRLPALIARHHPTLVIGDIGSESTRSLLHLERARRVLLLTGNDFANLNAASLMLERAPHLADHIVLHVSNLSLLRNVSHTRAARECVFFNGHQIAAEHLVKRYLLARFEYTSRSDTVVLAGFGTFGQSVLHALQTYAADGFSELVVADRRAVRRGAAFAEQVGFAGTYARHFITGDLGDLAMWDEMDARFELSAREPLIVVGTDDDMTNLECAITLRHRYPDAYIIVRQFKGSPFIDELARENNLQPFPMAALIAEAMPFAWCQPRPSAVRAARLLPEREPSG